MLSVSNTESQSVESGSSQALSKFACEYLQTFRCLFFGIVSELPAEIEKERPRWSELANAGIVTTN